MVYQRGNFAIISFYGQISSISLYLVAELLALRIHITFVVKEIIFKIISF